MLAGFLLALLWPSGAVYTDAAERRRYRIVQLLTLVGALLGAKLVVLMGDDGWPMNPIEPERLLTSGRSIVGGFLFGFVTAEVCKPLFGHTHPPNDRFARTLCFSVAIGRVGCLLAGCCGGLHGYPAQAAEIAFHGSLGVLFHIQLGRGAWRGTFFSRYLILYAVFRFASEFLRVTPKLIGPLSVYQLLCSALLACGVWSYLRYRQ